MHHICSKVKWARFHGTNVEGDFVEAPSQMLENWCWEKDSLRSLSEHYQRKGEALPFDLVDALIRSKLINVGHFYLRQIFFGRFDMTVHTEDDKIWTSERLVETWKNLRFSITGFEVQEGTFGGATFGHIMGGYDAGYYGYLWSLVISADMYYSRFKASDPAVVGKEYRDRILAPGGSQDAVDMIKAFLGRQATQDAFLKSIGLQ
jgi:Zn-dependent oligopeptidase